MRDKTRCYPDCVSDPLYRWAMSIYIYIYTESEINGTLVCLWPAEGVPMHCSSKDDTGRPQNTTMLALCGRHKSLVIYFAI